MTESSFHVAWTVPPGKWAVKKPFVGRWRIVGLIGYDDDYLNLCGPAMLRISTRGTGRMSFGAVDVELDCKTDDLDERVLRFTFEGGDEGDPICGRGYCIVEDNSMIGRLFRHAGDEYGFKAVREAEKSKSSKAPRPSTP